MKNFEHRNQPQANSKRSYALYGLLAYTLIFFLQIGSRVPILGKIRIEFWVGLLLLIYSVPAFLTIIKQHEPNRLINSIYWLFIAIFISIPTTVAGYNTINMLVAFVKAFAIFFMIMAGVRSEKDLKTYAYVLALSIGFIIVEAFIVRPMHNSSGLMRLNAVTLLFAHPNALGGLAAAILPLAYYIFHYEKNKLIKIGIIGFALVAIKVIFMTQSRSALVGVFAAGAYIWFMSKKKMVLTAVAAVALVVGWMSLDDVTRDRYLSIGDAGAVISGQTYVKKDDGTKVGRSSMAARYEIILDGFRLFIMRPVNGFGIGGYQVARIERLGRWQVCHNAYVQCLAELGILGFIPWCLILVTTFKNFTRARRILTEEGRTETQPFLSMLTYAFQGNLMVHFALSMFGHDPYDYYWWVAAAVSLKVLHIVQSGSNGQSMKAFALQQRRRHS